MTLEATIKNQGSGPTPAGVIHGVKFVIDETTAVWSDSYTASIAPGSSVTVTANGGPAGLATWEATTGDHTARAWVDDLNRIKESNDDNNVYDRAMTISIAPTPTPTPTPTLLPDLVVTQISWSPSSPVSGDVVTLEATIKNQGSGPTPAGVIHGVKFVIDETTAVWSDSYTASIAPGSSVTVTANGGPAGLATWEATTGDHTARAWVDDLNRIKESNDDNNVYDRAMTVPIAPTPTPTPTPTLLPDLVVTQISWSPSSPVSGDVVTLEATIKTGIRTNTCRSDLRSQIRH